MSNKVKVFEYLDSQEVRVVQRKEVPWFTLVDVCNILEISNHRNVAARLDSDEKGVHTMDTPGGKQQMIVVSESGLYAVILQSRKPEARAFRKWITSEVIPSIRKTGGYNLQEMERKVLRKLTSRLFGVHKKSVESHFYVPPFTGFEDFHQNGYQAAEADLLNVAVFGMPAKVWRKRYPDKAKGGKNQRDYATNEELYILSIIELLNALMLEYKVPYEERLYKLYNFAYSFRWMMIAEGRQDEQNSLPEHIELTKAYRTHLPGSYDNLISIYDTDEELDDEDEDSVDAIGDE